jgi:parallel beta-helix repeat protein
VGTFACTERGIRDAIEVGGGPHTFLCDGPTSVVTEAEIEIYNDVILDGEQNLTLDGDEDHRVLSVAEGATVELRGLAVANGSAVYPDWGGGIFNAGALTLVRSIVRDSVAETKYDCGRDPCWNAGGGIHNDGELTLVSSTVSGNAAFTGGGIASHGGLTMSDSTVSGNAAGAEGGGLHIAGVSTISSSTVSGNTAGSGGGINNGVNAALTLNDSTVSGNAAASGGGIYNQLGDFDISGCTVADNTAERGGGGIYNDPGGELTITDSVVRENAANGTDECPEPTPCNGGGGILNSGDSTITRSTVSGNTSASGGGGIYNRAGTLTSINTTLSSNTAVYDGGGISNRGRSSCTLTNTTLSGNTASEGSAVSSFGVLPVTLTNSVVDGDCTQLEGGEVAWTSGGYNIESSGDTCILDEGTDQVDVSAEDLMLGPLQDNGGATMTHALGAGSVAIDVIPAEMCEVDEDQRGEPRPGGAMCDVGAFEVQEGSL